MCHKNYIWRSYIGKNIKTLSLSLSLKREHVFIVQARSSDVLHHETKGPFIFVIHQLVDDQAVTRNAF